MKYPAKATVTATGLSSLIILVSACSSDDASQANQANGEEWQPDQNVTIVVPFGAGGGSDIFGRTVQTGLEDIRPDLRVQVENRDGGSGAVGLTHVISQEENPHVITATDVTAVTLPATGNVDWSHEDFTPIMQVALDTGILLVPADSPYQDLQEVIDATVEEQLLVGISAQGGVDDIQIANMEDVTGASFSRVVAGSGGEIVTQLLSGTVDVGILNPGEAIGQIEAGDLRGLAVFAAERLTTEPLDTIPTATEQDVPVEIGQWRGILGPPGLTDSQVKYWVDSLSEWVSTDAYTEYIDANFLLPEQRSGEEFGEYLDEYADLVQAGLD